MQPVLCLITRGVVPSEPEEDLIVARVAAAATAGVDLVQVRQPGAEGKALLRLVRRCLAAVKDSSTRVVVNSRLDVALAAGAHGLHLRSDDPDAVRIRTVAPPGFLLGRSVHDEAGAVRAASDGELDYLQVGTIFPSGSKPGRSPSGAAALARIASRVSLPVIGVGGMTLDRIREIRSTGAAGIAAIGLFDLPPEEMPRLVDAARRAFTDSGPVPSVRQDP